MPRMALRVESILVKSNVSPSGVYSAYYIRSDTSARRAMHREPLGRRSNSAGCRSPRLLRDLLNVPALRRSSSASCLFPAEFRDTGPCRFHRSRHGARRRQAASGARDIDAVCLCEVMAGHAERRFARHHVSSLRSCKRALPRGPVADTDNGHRVSSRQPRR